MKRSMPHGLAILIGQSLKKGGLKGSPSKESKEETSEDTENTDVEDVSKELVDAINSKDYEGIADAIWALMDLKE